LPEPGKAPPIIEPFGDVVVGGSSMAVGSPTNMGRIVHEFIAGEIEEIKIELTLDLFARRAINIPGILMGAVLGARTDNIKAYKSILYYVQEKGIKISIVKIERPEAQNIYIKTNIGEYSLISLNRGGGRIAILDALPSKDRAIKAVQKLGIVLVE
jgi:L-serine dehydratase